MSLLSCAQLCQEEVYVGPSVSIKDSIDFFLHFVLAPMFSVPETFSQEEAGAEL